jgi:curved DNA-binding protein CbpA
MGRFDTENLYELLGVSSNADLDAIKEAYRDLARIYHPDSTFYKDIIDSRIEPDHVEIFRRVTAAYEVLASPEKRAEYDKLLAKEEIVRGKALRSTAYKFGKSNLAESEEVETTDEEFESVASIIKSRHSQTASHLLVILILAALTTVILNLLSARVSPRASVNFTGFLL